MTMTSFLYSPSPSTTFKLVMVENMLPEILHAQYRRFLFAMGFTVEHVKSLSWSDLVTELG